MIAGKKVLRESDDDEAPADASSSPLNMPSKNVSKQLLTFNCVVWALEYLLLLFVGNSNCSFWHCPGSHMLQYKNGIQFFILFNEKLFLLLVFRCFIGRNAAQ